MKHPFAVLKDEYTELLGKMVVRPDKKARVDNIAVKLLSLKPRWEPISAENGVPIILMATSFEREASSNFDKNPAQGWSWRSRSQIIPRNGPFPSWRAAALEAYRLNGLDKVGAGNWTWELMCFYWEMFNGFGYRDYHAMHSPYLWADTNIQTIGKYTSDGSFDKQHWDTQIGVVSVARRMCEIDPTVALASGPIPAPKHSGLADPASAGQDTRWVQETLNKLGWQPPLVVDGSYGRKTKDAVQSFQRHWGLKVDFAGPETVKALKTARDAIESLPETDESKAVSS